VAVTALTWVGVAVVGGLGALARFGFDAFISSRTPGSFPVGTLVVNLTGALVLGVVSGVGLRGAALLIVATATLGSYTTFSTWMLEAHRLGEDGDGPLMALNLLGSLGLGFAAVALGHLIGTAL
jgi:CrcB protein